jgi:hypothetical protein
MARSGSLEGVGVNSFRILAISAFLLFIAVGCGGKSEEQIPLGPTGEPMDDRMMSQMVDEAAQYIALQLPRTPMVAQSKYRQVLGVGPIEVTGFASPARFQAGLNALQSKLLENEALQNQFRMVVTNSPDAIEIVREVGGDQSSFQDPRGNDPQSSRPQQFKAEDVFVLSGNFTKIRSGPETRHYNLLIKVVHPHSRQAVLSKDFQANFKWDEERQQWLRTQ